MKKSQRIKISQLIKSLQAMKVMYGDLPIAYLDNDGMDIPFQFDIAAVDFDRKLNEFVILSPWVLRDYRYARLRPFTAFIRITKKRAREIHEDAKNSFRIEQ